MVLRVLISLSCVYALASCSKSKLQGESSTPASAPELSASPTPPAQAMKPTQPSPSVLPEDFSVLCQNRGQVSVISSRQAPQDVGTPLQLPKSFGTLQWIRWIDPLNPQAGLVILEGDKNPAHPQKLHLASLNDSFSLNILKTYSLFLSDISDLSFHSGHLISKARYSYFHWDLKGNQVSVMPFETSEFKKVLLLSDTKALALSAQENRWVFYDFPTNTQKSLNWTTSNLISFYLAKNGTLYWIQKNQVENENPQQGPSFNLDLMSLSLVDQENKNSPSVLKSLPLKKAQPSSIPIWWTLKDETFVLFPLENLVTKSGNEIFLDPAMIQIFSWSMNFKVQSESFPYPSFIQQELLKRNLVGPQALGSFQVLNSAVDEKPQIFASLDLLGGIIQWNPETKSSRRIASYEVCQSIDVASLAVIQGLKKETKMDNSTTGEQP